MSVVRLPIGEGLRQMRKKDEAIKNLVTASIRRHSMNLESWERTKLWDNLNEAIQSTMAESIDVEDGELGVIAYFESRDYWYVLTTRSVVVWQDARIYRTPIEKID